MDGSNVPSLPLLVLAALLLVNQAPLPRSAAMKVTDTSAAPVDNFPVPPHCIPAWVIDASGVRRLPDRCFEPAATTSAVTGPGVSTPPSAPAPSAASAAPLRRATAPALRPAPRKVKDCSKPTYVDAQGIRRVRPECM